MAIAFTSLPSTEPPSSIALRVVDVFRTHAAAISTTATPPRALKSDAVLAAVRTDLEAVGFAVEKGKKKALKIARPVFYGENGTPTVQYQIDAYSSADRCGLEVEAGRAWMSNAVYRDLIQALVMVEVDHLILAVPRVYRFVSKKTKKTVENHAYPNTVEVTRALYGHTRVRMPYRLTVLGY